MAVFTLTPGTDNFTGLSGEDNTFNFTQLTLQPTDTITGGAAGSFIDILALTSSGTITAAQFAGVTNFEQLSLFAPGTVTLSNGFVANSSRAGGRMLSSEVRATTRSTAARSPMAWDWTCSPRMARTR